MLIVITRISAKTPKNGKFSNQGQYTTNHQLSRVSPFFLPEALNKQYHLFKKSNLGKIYQAIPWEKITKELAVKTNNKGPQNIFPPNGRVALMLLKSYAQTSDKKLIEHINGNIYYQFFCGIRLLPGQQITNYKIVSQIRCEIANNLKIEKIQPVLAQYWSPYIKDCSKVLIDATCYESSVRYPTDQKLLWESVFFSYKVLKAMCKKVGIRLTKTEYKKWRKRYNAYSRLRNKPKKERRAITRGLLRLLNKLDKILDNLEKLYTIEENETYQTQRLVIKDVLEQQWEMYETNTYPKNRILSLFKPYLRPIVRRKEGKNVEFGAKVNKIQIDGISFIQYLNFDPFNEGTKFVESVELAEKLTGIKIKKTGADAIYATKANRAFADARKIQTDFVHKGKADDDKEKDKQEAQNLRKERASLLEGSFGHEKEHYGLKKIKARTKKTEILWIFFGIHTGASSINCVN